MAENKRYGANGQVYLGPLVHIPPQEEPEELTHVPEPKQTYTITKINWENVNGKSSK